MTNQPLLRAWLPVSIALLAGCVNGPRLGESGEPLAVAEKTELPAPSGADLMAAATPYRVGPFDKLAITVFGAPELSGDFQTDAAGRLSMPLIGQVDAVGATPKELSDAIAAKLRGNYVRNPQVTVNLTETTNQKFTIDGQVTEPGSYAVVGNMSLMRAVAAAKGASEFARLDDVVVFRTVDGKPMAALYNLSSIRRGLYADPKIYPNDVVIVGDSKQRRMIQQILQVAPLLTTPLVIALERH
jgi:polysaccharide export outer membrane protein